MDDILKVVKELASKLKGKKMVYIAGDSRVCIALNQYFRKELKWDVKQIKTKPFWNPSKKGLE
ncbi:SIP domain-containing protein [Polaribacter sargassicola]|uniref:SIP domain-containing protein n=1 Tax=Polaribacter sargassicola TaxID=2836891 RepID=UPI001F3144A1|nr:SIP domain-containing protein [Polaribacter sp. DS7-9]MCG1036691.1 SIP domain-containing protein [Polaribacter sp. DS7-9]